MKKILKSLLVLGLVATTLGGTTKAWFTSGDVIASTNEIQTGTLLVAVDSTRAHDYQGNWRTGNGSDWDNNVVGEPYDAYNVVSQTDYDTFSQNDYLEPWTNAQPGTYTAYSGGSGIEDLAKGNRSIWFTVRNRGSIEAKAAVSLSGTWDNSTSCNHWEEDDDLVKLRNVHIYAGGSSGNCENHEECSNLRDALEGLGTWTHVDATELSAAANDTYDAGLGAGKTFYLSSGTDATRSGGDPIVLDPNEFSIVRADLHLDESAGGCYAGGTYQYDVTVNATQENNPNWN